MRNARPSATARVIAAATVMRRCQPEHPVQPPSDASDWSARFLGTHWKDRLLLLSAESSFGRALWAGFERLTLPGIVSHYVARKRAIETAVRHAVSEGATEVVILGAGLDALGLRLQSSSPDLSVIEVDHPATQAVKRQVLETSGRHLTLKSADLSLGFPSDLTTATVSHRAIVAEGLLMYFSELQVQSLIRAALRSAPKVTVLFTYMERQAHGGAGFYPHSALIDLWLRFKREPFLWSSRPDAMQAFVQSCGGRLLNHRSALEMLDKAGGSHGLAGENFVVCETTTS